MNRIGDGGKVQVSVRPNPPRERHAPPPLRPLADPRPRGAPADGALAGDDYWGTPGGGLEDGETFEQAAVRELREETGITVPRVDPPVAEREFVLRVPSGEDVMAHERYFLIDADDAVLSRDGWMADEVNVIAEHKWWTRDEITTARVQIWPDDILAMLARAGR